jgi:hypothetical protein
MIHVRSPGLFASSPPTGRYPSPRTRRGSSGSMRAPAASAPPLDFRSRQGRAVRRCAWPCASARRWSFLTRRSRPVRGSRTPVVQAVVANRLVGEATDPVVDDSLLMGHRRCLTRRKTHPSLYGIKPRPGRSPTRTTGLLCTAALLCSSGTHPPVRSARARPEILAPEAELSRRA